MTDLWAPRWRGRPGRLEVWYATLTDPASGLGFWLHHELVAPIEGAAYRQGWAVAFPPGGAPVVARFGGPGEAAGSGGVDWPPLRVPGRFRGAAGELRWSLDVRDGSPPLFPFPRWVWEHELLPAAQVVPAPVATFTGSVTVGGVEWLLGGARGAVARIYGHGNAARWAWLHADLGGGDALEVVTAVSRRPGLDRLRPLSFLRLRLAGRDWPAAPVLALPLLHGTIALPTWEVTGTVGRRRLRAEVTLDPATSVALDYADPDGPGPTCTHSTVASAEVVVERWRGTWAVERAWRLDATAHAEVGLR